MSREWDTFLSTLKPASEYTTFVENAIYPCIPCGFLTIQGPDAGKFLQGQLSCDVSTLSETLSGLGSHSTAKGRMLSSFRILQTDEHTYLLKMHNSIIEQAKAALAKYEQTQESLKCL